MKKLYFFTMLAAMLFALCSKNTVLHKCPYAFEKLLIRNMIPPFNNNLHEVIALRTEGICRKILLLLFPQPARILDFRELKITNPFCLKMYIVIFTKAAVHRLLTVPLAKQPYITSFKRFRTPVHLQPHAAAHNHIHHIFGQIPRIVCSRRYQRFLAEQHNPQHLC